LKRKNYNRYGVYFVIPFFLVFLAFSLFPIVYTFYLSVTNTKGFSGNMGDFVGLQNYVHIMGDSAFWQALWNTVRIWGEFYFPDGAGSVLCSCVYQCEV